MPLFRYTTKDKDGKIHRCQFEFESEKDLQQKLQKQGFELIEATLMAPKQSRLERRRDSSGRESPFVESSMETHGPQREGGDGGGKHKLVQMLIALAVALFAVAVWAFVR